MKINALKVNNNQISYNFKNNTAKAVNNKSFSFCSLPCSQKTDVDIKKLQEKEFFEEFMDKKGKVTLEEYEDIKKNHPTSLIYAQKLVKSFYTGDTIPEEMAELVLLTSKYLNENFENYRIISIGTSPAPLTEQLKNLGHDVVFLPISALDYCCNSSEMKTLTEYLKLKNINDGKLNLVLDYISSGHTLFEVTDYIKRNFHLRDKAIKKLSLNDILNHARHERQTSVWGYSKDMFDSSVENISNVPHFPVTPSGISRYKSSHKAGTIYMNGLSKEEIHKAFDDYSTPLARCFSLCTMAEIDRLKRSGKYDN